MIFQQTYYNFLTDLSLLDNHSICQLFMDQHFGLIHQRFDMKYQTKYRVRWKSFLKINQHFLHAALN